ncbi:MAG: DUF1343 domain-containing protein [Chthonomonadales bacterium]
METLTGIDVLERDNFKPLAGQRIGLITNHTGLTRDLRTTIDVLHAAPKVQLKALFGPEHGIRGEVDAKVEDSTDRRTGLPVYSLYGDTMRPKPEQLKGLDALVYDIQDIGCRFYTYPATLGNALEECAKASIHLIVLDRPNPIGGIAVEGPVSDPEVHQFVCWHPIPVRHGMTIGELARLYNSERKIGAGLQVIPCSSWKRTQLWDETGLYWTNPSPNMRSLTEAILYPGIGLLETTNISVGRGTDTPFEVIGAPWIDGRSLAQHLNSVGLPGVRFVPIRFKPKSSVFVGVDCSGINISITNRSNFKSVQCGFHIAVALQKLYPGKWQVEKYIRLLEKKEILSKLAAGATVGELEKTYAAGLREFAAIRQKYLIYP